MMLLLNGEFAGMQAHSTFDGERPSFTAIKFGNVLFGEHKVALVVACDHCSLLFCNLKTPFSFMLCSRICWDIVQTMRKCCSRRRLNTADRRSTAHSVRCRQSGRAADPVKGYAFYRFRFFCPFQFRFVCFSLSGFPSI